MRNIEGWPEEVRFSLEEERKKYSLYGCGSCKNAEWAATTMRKENDLDHFTGKTVEKFVIKFDLVLCRAGASVVSGNKLSPVRCCTMHNDSAEDSQGASSVESPASSLGFEAKPRNGVLGRGMLGLEPSLINQLRR